MKMFSSAAVRLSLWYLGIMMALSLFFSVALYQVSTREFDREINRLAAMQNSPLFVPRGFSEFQTQRLDQIEQSRRQIQLNILRFNLIIVGIGGVASYLFAKRTLEPIEEALEAQQRFTADASHELRTPLTAMKTGLEVALRDKGLTLEESKTVHRSNLEEVGRLERLSNSLLKLAQTHTATPTSASRPSDLRGAVLEATRAVEPMANAKNITIKQTLEDVVVQGDSHALTDLVTILLDNAVKYSQKHTTVTVTLHAVAKRNEAVVTVQDQGVGIRTIDLPHLFERFYRADQSRSRQHEPGYGLGLAIAKTIVDRHHGKITVESTPGKGSAFTVHLPLP